ncbi:hypothetical protein [Patulibacter sp.]|uniref:hypothetical protein n=1 Tax=Patulibacter sp. TaxID=1912859 RepID=UPI002716107E|nr:hypothetical protein [Patulibacter sp.]MDO9409715.1 hypothetical protein [Patulibacter sp.]
MDRIAPLYDMQKTLDRIAPFNDMQRTLDRIAPLGLAFSPSQLETLRKSLRTTSDLAPLRNALAHDVAPIVEYARVVAADLPVSEDALAAYQEVPDELWREVADDTTHDGFLTSATPSQRSTLLFAVLALLADLSERAGAVDTATKDLVTTLGLVGAILVTLMAVQENDPDEK